MPPMPRRARPSMKTLLLLAFRHTVAHDSFYSNIMFTLKKRSQGFTCVSLSTCGTPPDCTPPASRSLYIKRKSCTTNEETGISRSFHHAALSIGNLNLEYAKVFAFLLGSSRTPPAFRFRLHNSPKTRTWAERDKP